MSDSTADKEVRKEVFDYLRQLQKREEQHAKTSGMSSWVLVAAMCYVAAWLLNNAATLGSLRALELGLAFGLNILFLQVLILPARPRFITEGARLTKILDDDLSKIGLNIIFGGIALIPPIYASFLLFGWTFAVILCTFFSVVFVITFVLGPIFKHFVKKQYFRSVSKTSAWAELLVTLLTLLSLTFHTRQLVEVAFDLPKEHLVFAAYATALWWVMWQLMLKVNSAAKTKEYAHLEAILMFGVATPSEILKKLELEVFGPSLEKDLKSLEDAIEVTDKNYNAALATFKQIIVETKEVPSSFQHEIKARTHGALAPFHEAYQPFMNAIEAKVDYIKSLLVVKPSQLDSSVRQLLEREIIRLKDRTSRLKSEVNNVIYETKDIISNERVGSNAAN